jgi:hypothetical protein
MTLGDLNTRGGIPTPRGAGTASSLLALPVRPVRVAEP